MNKYQAETLVQVSVVFTVTDTGDPVDPTDVFLYVEDPEGNVTTYTGVDITKTSVGNYLKQFVVDQVGVWIFKWRGTGTVEITTPDRYLQVQPSAINT